jgi:hypothetical protein
MEVTKTMETKLPNKEESRSLTERLQDGLTLFCTAMLAADDLLKFIEALIRTIH